MWKRVSRVAKKTLLVNDDLLLALKDGGVISQDELTQNMRVMKSEPSKAAEHLFRDVLNKKESNSGFLTFLSCLQHSSAGCNKDLADQLKESVEMPTAKKILELPFTELQRWSSDLGITAGKGSAGACRIEVLKSYDRASFLEYNPLEPPITLNESVQEIFHQNKREFVASMKTLKTGIDENKDLLERLKLQKLEVWNSSGLYQTTVDRCTSGKPTILFAGSTSSGKSTLLNAFFGDDIMPTSYNACTSALCTITHFSSYIGKRPNDSTKFAVVHLELHDGGEEIVCLDLSVESHRKGFKKMVGIDRSQMKNEVTIEDKQYKYKACYQSEVYLPLELLKHVNLVDSPGVTEDTKESVFLKLTTEFQERVACGFVYVLNASNAAEEASQVGGLLSQFRNAFNNTCPAPGAALFVLNKWDLLPDQLKVEYEQIVATKLTQYWKDFSRERQLFKMNSKVAYFGLRLGCVPGDMELLCAGLSRTIPVGMDALFLKHFAEPRGLVKEIKKEIELTIEQLQLPDQKRKIREKAERGQLEAFQQSLQSGEIAEAMQLIGYEIRKVAVCLRNHFKELYEGYASYLSSLPEPKWPVSVKDLGYMVQTNVHEQIRKFKRFREFCTWVQTNKMLEKRTKSIVRNFNLLKNKLRAHRPLGLLQELTENAVLVSERERVLSATLSAALSTFFGGVTFAKGLKIAREETSFAKRLASANQCVVNKLFEKDLFLLQKLLIELARESCESIRLIYGDAPDQYLELEQKINARHEEETENLGRFTAALAEFDEIDTKFAKVVFQLGIHKISSTEVSQSLLSESDMKFGQFGKICKVPLGSKTVAMKVGVETVDYSVSQMEDELEKYRKFSHVNLVKFLESVGLGKDPLKVGFLFEWVEGRTLEETLLEERWTPASMPAGFGESKEVLQQILKGVRFLHFKQIAHLNIRCGNIIVSMAVLNPVVDVRERVKLGGVWSGEAEVDVYSAPEVEQNVCQPGTPADVYSIGVVMWELWIGKHVDSIPTLSSLLGKCFSSESRIEKEWIQIASKCWEKAPFDRPSASDVLETVSTWD
eukprot:m.26850 g.26850  ORF g.26850 m.26850 type:complete len:1054 (+) comp29557_c0_seq5:322-3483(+)